MTNGSLKLRITDLLDVPVKGRMEIEFQPDKHSAGGTSMEVDFSVTNEKNFVVEKVQCRGGPGTRYIVRVNTSNFRSFAFFQMILEEKVNTPSDSQIQLSVEPKRVKDIDAPGFSKLPTKLSDFLANAEMKAAKDEDKDLLGLKGGLLYDALGPLRKALLLNLFTKASHGSSDRCFRFLGSPWLIRQDRCFCSVSEDMPESLRRSVRFKSAPNILHEPLSGFRLEDSFKSKDAHANLQVTFMRKEKENLLAADIDIDESSGIEHGFEVIRNAIKGRTNPYLVRELMLLADPVEKVLDPGYRFVF